MEAQDTKQIIHRPRMILDSAGEYICLNCFKTRLRFTCVVVKYIRK